MEGCFVGVGGAWGILDSDANGRVISSQDLVNNGMYKKQGPE